jgi:isopenicillin-N epimerase
MNLPNYSPLIQHWKLNKNIVYLNHGSFGATPTKVLEKQLQLQMENEAEAIEFYIDKLPNLINTSKAALANYVGTDSNNIVFIQNTTTGVNTILNSLTANEGDEWLTTNHAYGACVHAFKHFATKHKCNVVTAIIDYPIISEDAILEAIEKSITPKTTIALMDYVTSASAIILPIKKIIDLLHSKGIKVIVDAAHAPGMVDFNIEVLQPDFFIANCHKWICSPKGSAFIYVAPQHQPSVNPLVISHYNDTNEGEATHWSNQFMWDGTHDYSAYICVKDALEYMPALIDGGWDAIKKHNHELVWAAANKIATALQVTLPVPKAMVGAICNIPMPDGVAAAKKFHSNVALKDTLFHKYKIEVPIFMFPTAPTQWLRISAQLYNSMEQYDYLLACLKEELK